MARMAGSERTSRRSRSRGTDTPQTPVQPLVNAETQKSILIILLLTFAVVAALSVFGLAGYLGNGISHALGTLFGWQRYLVPVYFAFIGFGMLFPEKLVLSRRRWIGFILALIASEALLQMFLPLDESIKRAIHGEGGGYVGVFLNYPLRSALNAWAAGIIIVALLLTGLMILLNTTLKGLAYQGNFFNRFFQRWQTQRWDKKLHEEPEPVEEGFEKRELPADKQPKAPEAAAPAEAEEELIPVAPKPVKRERREIAIPLDLLETSTSKPTSGNIDANKEKIKRTLETFGISVEMGEVNVGPTVTQFTLKPAEGVKLAQITALNNDLALALAAHPIRIEAPIPGKSLVGIEVPNQAVAVVQLREILASDEFKHRKTNLTFSLGKDVSGKPWTADIGPLPHLLIAGATGSGKSVQINSLILSLLYSNSPDDLKLILVDPKRVELSLYNNIPHLLTPVITDSTKTINALRWVVSEMDRRYQVLQNAGKRNIASYRAEVSTDMPYLVLVIDELADLMTVAANEVEGAIVRLAQMARAVGIHLVLATQRPSVDVITGLIKANVTARIAFSVASQIDSRTILDTSGAEKLLGRGDMLFVSAELSKPKRLQGAFVSEKEVERVTQFLKQRGEPDYMQEITEKPTAQIGGSMEDLGDDELLPQSKEVILQSGKASASLLQRRLRVGYARAARILDLLEEQGFIGPGEGAKPREVYGSTEIAGSERDADDDDLPPTDDAPDQTAEEEPQDRRDETLI